MGDVFFLFSPFYPIDIVKTTSSYGIASENKIIHMEIKLKLQCIQIW